MNKIYLVCSELKVAAAGCGLLKRKGKKNKEKKRERKQFNKEILQYIFLDIFWTRPENLFPLILISYGLHY